MYVDIDSQKHISIMEMDARQSTALHKALVRFSAIAPQSFEQLGLQQLFQELTEQIKLLGHGN